MRSAAPAVLFSDSRSGAIKRCGIRRLGTAMTAARPSGPPARRAPQPEAAALGDAGMSSPRAGGYRLMRHDDRRPADAIAFQPPPTSSLGTDHPLGFQEQPGVPRRQDGCRVRHSRPVGDAGVAARRAGFAAIVRLAARAADSPAGRSRNSRAPSRRTARRARWIRRAHVEVDAHQVMHMHARHCGRAQHRGEIIQPLRRQRRSGRPGSAGTDSAAPRAVDCNSRQLARAGEARDEFGDVPPHAAAQVVRQHQDHRQARAAEQRGGQREPKRPGRIVASHAARPAARSPDSAGTAVSMACCRPVVAPAPKLTEPSW